jgi:hypothetical protein
MSNASNLPRKKIFLSWSTRSSRLVAEAIGNFLSLVIPDVKPWISSHDISPGIPWAPEIGTAMQEVAFGILCIVPGNQRKPWLLYEAGALTAAALRPVTPLLLGLTESELELPLGQLNAVIADEAGMTKLVSAIAETIASKTTKEQRTQYIEKFLPDLLRELAAIDISVDEGIASDRMVTLREVADAISTLQHDISLISRREQSGISAPLAAISMYRVTLAERNRVNTDSHLISWDSELNDVVDRVRNYGANQKGRLVIFQNGEWPVNTELYLSTGALDALVRSGRSGLLMGEPIRDGLMPVGARPVLDEPSRAAKPYLKLVMTTSNEINPTAYDIVDPTTGEIRGHGSMLIKSSSEDTIQIAYSVTGIDGQTPPGDVVLSLIRQAPRNVFRREADAWVPSGY